MRSVVISIIHLVVLLLAAERQAHWCLAQELLLVGVGEAQKISSRAGGFPPDALGNSDQFGRSITAVGDLNGDQTVDICVGAFQDDDGGTGAGAVYVLFLNFNGTVKGAQKLSARDGGLNASGVELDAGDQFGISAAGVGDLNGDRVPDVAVGASGDDDAGLDRGAVYLLFLTVYGTVGAQQKISSLEGGLPSGTLSENNTYFGFSLANLTDLNGDQVTDLCVGAPEDDEAGTNRGAVHILFLRSDGTGVQRTQKITNSAGGNGDAFGSSIAGLGDLDDDGVPDVCVGARFADSVVGGGNDNVGAVYVFLLNRNGTVLATQKISNATGGLPAGLLDGADGFGDSTSRLGDLDGDQVTELCVGASRDDDGGENRGALYVLFLNTNGSVKAIQKISSTEGALNASGVVLGDTDRFGEAVAVLGAVMNGGIFICVGADQDDDGGGNRGAVYVLFLQTSAVPATTSITPPVTTAFESSTATTGGAVTSSPAVSTTTILRTSSTESGGQNDSLLVFIILGILAFLAALLVGGLVFWLVRRRRVSEDRDSSEVELDSDSDTDTQPNADTGGNYQNLPDGSASDNYQNLPDGSASNNYQNLPDGSASDNYQNVPSGNDAASPIYHTVPGEESPVYHTVPGDESPVYHTVPN